MDDKEFEERLNKEKSFITSKNHTKEFEKQLEEQRQEHEVKDTEERIEQKKQDIRNRLFSEDEDDILESSDSSGGGAGIVAAFIGVLVVTIVGVGVALPVIQDTLGGTNVTGVDGPITTIVNLLPLMIGLVIFIAVASLITLRR